MKLITHKNDKNGQITNLLENLTQNLLIMESLFYNVGRSESFKQWAFKSQLS